MRTSVFVAALMFCGSAFAQGSMAPEVNSAAPAVRVIRVSPSVSVYGTPKEQRQQKQWEAREAVKFNNQVELENLKAYNKRLLEADKAYYKKLAEQRKAGKK